MANFVTFSVFIIFVVVQSGLAFKCYRCDARLDRNCKNPKLIECYEDSSKAVQLLISNYKPACMTLVAYTKHEIKIISKRCIVDLSSAGVDQCDVAKTVATKLAKGSIYNVTCEICKSDSCNSGDATYLSNEY